MQAFPSSKLTYFTTMATLVLLNLKSICFLLWVLLFFTTCSSWFWLLVYFCCCSLRGSDKLTTWDYSVLLLHTMIAMNIHLNTDFALFCKCWHLFPPFSFISRNVLNHTSKNSSFNNWFWEYCKSKCRKMKLEHYLIPCKRKNQPKIELKFETTKEK